MSLHRLQIVAWAALLPLLITGCTKKVNVPTTKAPEPRGVILASGLSGMKTLQQDWTDAEANWFYTIQQGSKLMPYTWFLNLEQATLQKPFRDADHIREIGYLPRSPDAFGNPDGLPIGFVKDGEHVGFTCAACHTNQLNYKGTPYLIDGAPTLADASRLQTELVGALKATLTDNAKFERFATGVLGASPSDAAKAQLKKDLTDTSDFRDKYNQRNFPSAQGTPFGAARIDAFGAILNEVGTIFAEVPDNHVAADAPVSYPFLWDTPQHDFVQWNGSAQNQDIPLLKPFVGTEHIGAMSRNVGEVLGVFGQVDAKSVGSLLEFHSYASSVNKPNLIAVEELLRKLWSPQIPAEIATIDEKLRAPGAALFTQFCVECHADIKRDDPNRKVTASIKFVGTDQTMARNVATRMSNTGVLKGRLASLRGAQTFGDTAGSTALLVHLVERIIVRPDSAGSVLDALNPFAELDYSPNYLIHARIKVGDQHIEGAFRQIQFEGTKVKSLKTRGKLKLINAQQKTFHQDLSTPGKLNHFSATEGGETDLPADSVKTESVGGVQETTLAEAAPAEFGYKGRPLNGIWATAPYLHNGSVPNLDELLKPAKDRVTKFHVGIREFDPVKVGFADEGGVYDTSLPGNSNSGHEYGAKVFTDDERRQLIEYLKSL